MPICHLLEGVAGAQNQRLFHVPSDNLEPNRKAIGGLPAGQCQALDARCSYQTAR